MSKLETNTIDTISGSTNLTLGGTNATDITIPSGVTITNNGTQSGFGGITSAQEFRLASDQTGSASAGTVLTNWEENDTDYQAIGSNWSQSSGIFSCSATGIYTAAWTLVTSGASANDAFDPNIQISTDSGSNYSTRAKCWEYVSTSDTASSIGNTFMFKVSNTSTFRLRFRQSQDNDVGSTTTIKGSSTESLTNIVFVRLGDT